MRVAVVMLTAGSLSGGAAKHLQYMVPRMISDPRISELRVFLPRDALPSIPENWKVFEWPAWEGRFGRPALKRQLVAFGPDVVFVPTARWIGTAGAKTVVMVRNMEPFTPHVHGNRFKERLRNRALLHIALRACDKADAIIAVSEHVRELIGRLRPEYLPKTHVIYHGIEDPPEPQRPSSLDRLGDLPFVFTAGSIRPARGLTDVVNAWTSGSIDPLPHLVVAGAAVPHLAGYQRSLIEQATAAGVGDKILWAGNLSNAEMSWCFRRSCLFVMTSRAEACPNTVLEAMRHGALSISTDTPPMPEFFRDSAIYYSAGDENSLADAVQQALNLSTTEERELRDLAHRRARDFDWERTAKETVELLARTR